MLNPDKCVFRVSAGKLLGFLVFHWGIEADPEKIKAIEVMWPPTCIKDVQKLMGCLAVHNRFISKLVEQALLFFKLLRKTRPFVWTQEADEAFQELKQYMMSLSIMVAPEPGEPLLLYIAATVEVVSIVLVVERPEPKQLQALKGAHVAKSGSQDSDPADGSCDHEAFRSQHLEVPSGHMDQVTSGSQIPEPTLGPNSQHTVGSQLSEVPSGPGVQEPPAPEPLQMDPPDPLERV
jgi:hypothetical protein